MGNKRAAQCRKNADECRAQANRERHPDQKAAWLKMADDWLRLADDVSEKPAEVFDEDGRATIRGGVRESQELVCDPPR